MDATKRKLREILVKALRLKVKPEEIGETGLVEPSEEVVAILEIPILCGTAKLTQELDELWLDSVEARNPVVAECTHHIFCNAKSILIGGLELVLNLLR